MPKHDPIATAKDYTKRFGARLGLVPFDPTPSALKVDKELSRRAGAAFEAMKHEPRAEHVAAAYAQLKKEVLLQYAHMVHHGMQIEPWRSDGQPYQNSKEMAHDVRENGHLWYFPTDSGFGEGDQFADHPLYEKVPGTEVRYNDMFRAVHDYYAHAQHGHQFGPQGEMRAWHEHSKMFSPLAKKALTTETHGQNSWVNFGPHNPESIEVTKRPYADQKAGLLPEEVWPKPESASAVTNREPHKLARSAGAYRLQPGEPVMGGEDFIHEIHDENGARIGHVWVQPKDGGETLHINHIGAAGHVPNASGLANVRDVVRQLREHYPNAKRLTGKRVSGRREGNEVAAKLARGSALAKHDDFWTHLNSAKSSIVNSLPYDRAALGVLADHIGEMTSGPDDPRSHIVRHADHLDQFGDLNFDAEHGDTHGKFYRFTDWHDDGMTGGAYHDVSPKAYQAGPSEMSFGYVLHSGGHTAPAAMWRIHIPRTKSASGKTESITFHRVFRDTDELHDFIRRLPRANQKAWLARALRHGWRDWSKSGRYTEPHRFAEIRPTKAGVKPGGTVRPKRDVPTPPPLTDDQIAYSKRKYRDRNPEIDAKTGLAKGTSYEEVATPSAPSAKPDASDLGPEYSGFGVQMLQKAGLKTEADLRRVITPKVRAWAYENAERHVDEFMRVHGYTERATAKQHLAMAFIHAGLAHRSGMTGEAGKPFRMSIAHPTSGKRVNITVRKPSLGAGRVRINHLPNRLARKKTERTRSEHDLMLSAAEEGLNNGDHVPLAVFADKREEEGKAGAHMAREAAAQMHARGETRPIHQIAWEGPGGNYLFRPGGHTTVIPELTNGDGRWLRVEHLPDDADHFTVGMPSLTYRVRVRSRKHLVSMMRDWNPHARMEAWNMIAGDLPSTHPDDDKPVQLARTTHRVDNTGSATASAHSVNHDKRLEVVRQVLKEAGLTPASVRAALAHNGGTASPAFASVIQRSAHPDHVRYTAAWLGLMTGQKRLAVAHPDDNGEDFLHIITAPGHPDHLTGRLRDAGVQRFTTERTDGGSRAYILNPLGKMSSAVDQVARSIPNASHSFGRVRVYRLGAGPSSDAATSRAAYRSVIDDFERAAGGGGSGAAK